LASRFLFGWGGGSTSDPLPGQKAAFERKRLTNTPVV